MRWPWSKKPEVETRQAAGFTSEIIAARQQYFSGARGVAEATATVETAVSLWERAFATADVPDRWREVLSPFHLALIGRALATRGQFVALIDSTGPGLALTPAVDWDVSTRRGSPVAYRLQIPEAGGGFQITALADEVIDVRINVDPTTPWHGVSSLRKARLTADLLEAIEGGLTDVLTSPWGALIQPMPRVGEHAASQLSRFQDRLRSARGGFWMVESNQTVAPQNAPHGDWDAKNLTPNITGLGLSDHWEAVRSTILGAFGLPPMLFASDAQSAALREGQRHCVLWTLSPIGKVASAELGRKLDDPDLKLDLVTPLAAADSAGRARAVGILVGNGMPMADALELVGWEQA